MKIALSKLLMLFLAGLCAAACCNTQRLADATMQSVSGFVTDQLSFEKFIATTPTPAQFRSRYPDVTLVLPGDIASKELRHNHSRYFAQLNDEGCIVSGKFQ